MHTWLSPLVQIALSLYFTYFLKSFIYIYLWLCWIFVVSWAFSLVAVSRGHSPVAVQGRPTEELSLVAEHGFWGHAGFSGCGSHTLEHKLRSCGARAYFLCGLCDLPGSGTEHTSPALAGGSFTAEPTGKPLFHVF